jgi:two-component system sensor histidine kinase RegB
MGERYIISYLALFYGEGIYMPQPLLLDQFRLLCGLRLMALLGHILGFVMMVFCFQASWNNLTFWLFFAGYFLLTTFTYCIVNKKCRFFLTSLGDVGGAMALQGHLVLDVIMLWGLLYSTSGAASPFTSLFIIPVIISAISLPVIPTYIMAVLSITLYGTLFIVDQHAHHVADFYWHMLGMWCSFVLLAGVVVWFITRLSRIITRQQQLLAQTEKVTALGLLATQAAHDLGTPLANIALLSETLDDKNSILFSQQIQRCKEILRSITAQGGQLGANKGKPLYLDDFCNEIMKSWQIKHPEHKIEYRTEFEQNPLIIAEYGLQQAIEYMLDNAFCASPDTVLFHVQSKRNIISFMIIDAGDGYPANMLNQPMPIGITSKPHGIGLGVFLAKTVIERLGGSWEMTPVKPQGTMITMSIPRPSIELQ